MSTKSWTSTLLHLRIPFSFFLLPIFFFALQASSTIELTKALAAFFIIHFLLYPASQAYNTWYDRDQGSIGLLKTPPPVYPSLIKTAWILDILALGASLLVGLLFFFLMVLYTLCSKLYSHPKIRFKKHPISGWLGVGIIQGAIIFIAVVQGLGHPRLWSDPVLLLGTLISFLFLLGIYPMTQIYQHEEDSLRGDRTISLVLGIKGTFLLCGLFLALAGGSFGLWFYFFQKPFICGLFFLFQLPLIIFFFYWAFQSFKNPEKADFQNTMILNFLASGLINLFFVLDFLLR